MISQGPQRAMLADTPPLPGTNKRSKVEDSSRSIPDEEATGSADVHKAREMIERWSLTSGNPEWAAPNGVITTAENGTGTEMGSSTVGVAVGSAMPQMDLAEMSTAVEVSDALHAIDSAEAPHGRCSPGE